MLPKPITIVLLYQVGNGNNMCGEKQTTRADLASMYGAVVLLCRRCQKKEKKRRCTRLTEKKSENVGRQRKSQMMDINPKMNHQ